MNQASVRWVLLSGLGVLARLGACSDWAGRHRAAGARRRVKLLGRPARRVLKGSAGVVVRVGPGRVGLIRP